MAIDKDGAKLIHKAGREIAEKGIRDMVKRNNKVNNIITDYCNIKGEKVQIICPYNIQKYSLTFNIKDKQIPSNLKFDFGNIADITLYSIEGLNDYKNTIEIQDTGFIFNLKKLPKNYEYIMEIDYQMQDDRFMNSFVNTKGSKDAPYNEDDNKSEYWLEAHLKHPSLLKDKYRSVNLKDLDVGVNVSIGQDINMKIPGALKDELNAIVKLSKGGSRSEMYKNAMKLHSIQHGKYGGEGFDILRTIQDYFTSTVFGDFIEVKQDFSYFNCIRGENFHEKLPMYSWPKFMRVFSRCDLGLENPAAMGILLYKRKDFISEISKILKLK
jgi:hypothetical protein